MANHKLECCCECDEPTERAGASDDSIFCDTCGIGPLCSECHDKKHVGRRCDPKPMTDRPKPPSPFKSWLDYLVDRDETPMWDFDDDEIEAIHAELAELRAKAAKWDERCEELLRVCHTAPQAVEMDTRDISTAVHRLVGFAWKCVDT